MGIKLPRSIVLIALSIAFLAQNGRCAKIAVIPAFGGSHVHVLNILAQALIERGHDVCIEQSVFHDIELYFLTDYRILFFFFH